MNARLEKRIRNGIEPLLRPDEKIEVMAYGFRSPLPFWVWFVFEGALLLLLMTPYYIALTGERLVMAKVSRLSTSKTSPGFDFARNQVTVRAFRKNLFWPRMLLETPEGTMRLRFPRQRAEVEQLAKALQAGAAGEHQA